jgi:hypothetical protein
MPELVFIIVILVLLIIFKDPIIAHFSKPAPAPEAIPEAPLPKSEYMESVDEPDMMTALGYVGSQPWDETIKLTELDPSTFVHHNEFTKDTRRFSSGANFTSVADDNTSDFFTNFQGLRRPQHVPISPFARQQPDVDQTVLMRNKSLRWTSGPNFDV